MLITVDDASPQVIYGPSEWNVNHSEDSSVVSYFQQTFHGTTKEGAYATFAFYGDSIKVYGAKRFNHAIYEVQLDNEPPQRFNGQADTDAFQAVLFEKDGMKLANHTITLTHRPSLSNLKPNTSWLDIDYFLFGNSQISDKDVVTTLWDDTDANIKYTGGPWTAGDTELTIFHNATVQMTSSPGAYMELNFTGHSFQIVGGTNFDHGQYSVEVDGSSQELNGTNDYFIACPVYTSSGLQDQQHHVKVIALSKTFDFDYVVFNSSRSAAGAVQSNSTSADGVTAPTSSAKSSNVGAIAGGVVAGVLVSALLVMLIFWLKRRKRATTASRAEPPVDLNGDEITPYEDMTQIGGGGNVVTARDADHTRLPFLTIPPAPASSTSSYPMSHNPPSTASAGLHSPPSSAAADPFATPESDDGLLNPFGSPASRVDGSPTDDRTSSVAPSAGHGRGQGTVALSDPHTFGQQTPDATPVATPTIPKQMGVILPFTASAPLSNTSSSATSGESPVVPRPRISEEAMRRARMKVEGREIDAGPALVAEPQEELLPPGYEQATQPLPGQRPHA